MFHSTRIPVLTRRRRWISSSGASLADYAANSVSPALVADFENGVYLSSNELFTSADDLTLAAGATISGGRLNGTAANPAIAIIPTAKFPTGTAFSFVISGEMTYTDDGTEDLQFYRWYLGSTNYLRARMTTAASQTGYVVFTQRHPTSGTDSVNASVTAYGPGTDVPFSVASRHTAGAINGATSETVLTANTTPTALFDGSATDFDLGFSSAGTAITMKIQRFVAWNSDIGDAGLLEATAPFDSNAANAVFTSEADRVSTFDGDLVYVAG